MPNRSARDFPAWKDLPRKYRGELSPEVSSVYSVSANPVCGVNGGEFKG